MKSFPSNLNNNTSFTVPESEEDSQEVMALNIESSWKK